MDGYIAVPSFLSFEREGAIGLPNQKNVTLLVGVIIGSDGAFSSHTIICSHAIAGIRSPEAAGLTDIVTLSSNCITNPPLETERNEN